MSPATYPRCSIPSSLAGCADILTPIIGAVINKSLHGGNVPATLKTGIITPLQKKQGGDPSDMGNLRPITGIKTVAKVMEGFVAR